MSFDQASFAHNLGDPQAGNKNKEKKEEGNIVTELDFLQFCEACI